MFGNYVITALRNLVHNRLYAAINIFGLTVGFAAALLMALFVRDELSYDRWLPNSHGVYMVSSRLADVRGQTDFVPEDIAPDMKLDFPGVDKVVRLEGDLPFDLRHGDVAVANQQVFFADPDFFSVIQLPALAGDLNTALDTPDGVVITQAVARTYFGEDAPIGQVLELMYPVDGRVTLVRVTAVLKDLPSNTQFNTQVVISNRSALSEISQIEKKQRQLQSCSMGCPTPNQWLASEYTYFTLKPGASIAEINQGLPGLIARHKAATIPTVGPTPLYTLPMTRFHFSGTRQDPRDSLNPPGNRAAVTSIAVVGVLILFIAAVNFVNLSSARASRRAVEVGVRKTIGAKPSDLMIQFIGEAVLSVAFSMAVAAMMVALALPAFDAYLKRTILFDFWADPLLLSGIIGSVLVVGVAAGAYPAFVLSRFRARTALRSGSVQSAASSSLRSVLVVLQFGVLVGLILMTLVVYRQTDYALSSGTHMDTVRVHVVQRACTPALQDAIRAIPGVERTACSNEAVLSGRTYHGIFDFGLPSGATLPVDYVELTMGLFEFYGLKPIAGRVSLPDFSDYGPRAQVPGQPPQRRPIVVNEMLARMLSPNDPAGAAGMIVRLVSPPPAHYEGVDEREIIGVVPDFAVNLPRRAVVPTFYPFVPLTPNRAFFDLSVKLRAADDEKSVLTDIDKAWKEVGPRRPISRYAMDLYLKNVVNADIIRQGQILTAFSAVAVFIAALGLFGLSAFTAETRTKEIGIRKAMGASKADILAMLLRQFTKPVLLANLIAWPAAYLVMSRWLSGFTAHINLTPWMFLGTSALALVIAVTTVLGHALLVARAKPVAALRYE